MYTENENSYFKDNLPDRAFQSKVNSLLPLPKFQLIVHKGVQLF